MWEQIKCGDKRAQWAGLYVTMNNKGWIVMNKAAYERIGSPDAFHLLFDNANNSIGLKPTHKAMRYAYPAHVSGKHGGRRVNAYRLLTEHCIHFEQTLEFPDALIDEDGILTLNLRTAVVSKRALNHPSKRVSTDAILASGTTK